MDVITVPENLTTSDLSILLHGVISLPDAMSCDNRFLTPREKYGQNITCKILPPPPPVVLRIWEGGLLLIFGELDNTGIIFRDLGSKLIVFGVYGALPKGKKLYLKISP